MTELRLQVPDDHVAFFLELTKKLGYQIDIPSVIPDAHKEVVRQRIKKQNEENLIPWEEAINKLKS